MESPIATANATACAAFVDELSRRGVTDVVICPGSRSTPLAVAFARHPAVRTHIHVDERSGAFMALGLAKTEGKHVPVVTTSGTAAAELHAAVVEASLEGVPYLALTADRPPRLRGVGAPQTIDQLRLYGSAVDIFADAPLPHEASPIEFRQLAAQTLSFTVAHLNFPFDEPLLGEPTDQANELLDEVDEAGTSPQSSARTVEYFSLPPVERGVIVAGGPIDDPAAVLRLAEQWQWPVLADPRSGCRVPHPAVIAHADGLLRDVAPRVDLVVRFGSLPASKVVNQWLGAQSVPHFHIAPHARKEDPYGVVSERVISSASEFCAGIAPPSSPRPQNWLEKWRKADDAFAAAINQSLSQYERPTEPAVARAIVQSLPAQSLLVVSSSMPVRDVEWYSEPRAGIRVLANRGANGIDGVVSTAVGAALSGAPTALFIGDLAFLHDTNGLLGLTQRNVNLCLVVLDNEGGGIFSFLPQASALGDQEFELLFGTPQNAHIPTLAHAHDIPVLQAEDSEAVGIAVKGALATGGVHLVYVRTNRKDNVDVHGQLNAVGLDAARRSGWPA